MGPNPVRPSVAGGDRHRLDSPQNLHLVDLRLDDDLRYETNRRLELRGRAFQNHRPTVVKTAIGSFVPEQ